MDIVKYNLTNIKYNLTNRSVGEYKSILKYQKKKSGTNLSEARLSEAISTNLMQQLGSLKDTFDTYLNKKCLCMSFIFRFSDGSKYFWRWEISF